MDISQFNPSGVGVDNGSYFGLPFTIDSARLVLVSAPWDVTVSYGAGTAYAPDAIIEASTQLDLYDPSAPDAWRDGIATAEVDYSILELSERLRPEAERVISHLESGGALEDDYAQRRVRKVNEGSEQLNEKIYAQTSELLRQGKVVGIVGGDHSVPYGAIKALGEREESFGVLHIDAHADLRVAYEGFEFSHASFIYNILRDVSSIKKVVQVAQRDMCDDELAFSASTDRVEMFDDRQIAKSIFEGDNWSQICDRIVSRLPERVYISLDIDGLEMGCCPNSGTPVPGGLSFNQVVYLLETLTQSSRQIIGFDIVEVAPNPAQRIDAIVGARMLYKLASQTLLSNKNK